MDTTIRISRGYIPVDENNVPYFDTIFVNVEVDPEQIETISINTQEWYSDALEHSKDITEDCMAKAYFLYAIEKAIHAQVLEPAL